MWSKVLGRKDKKKEGKKKQEEGGRGRGRGRAEREEKNTSNDNRKKEERVVSQQESRRISDEHVDLFGDSDEQRLLKHQTIVNNNNINSSNNVSSNNNNANNNNNNVGNNTNKTLPVSSYSPRAELVRALSPPQGSEVVTRFTLRGVSLSLDDLDWLAAPEQMRKLATVSAFKLLQCSFGYTDPKVIVPRVAKIIPKNVTCLALRSMPYFNVLGIVTHLVDCPRPDLRELDISYLGSVQIPDHLFVCLLSAHPLLSWMSVGPLFEYSPTIQDAILKNYALTRFHATIRAATTQEIVDHLAKNNLRRVVCERNCAKAVWAFLLVWKHRFDEGASGGLRLLDRNVAQQVARTVWRTSLDDAWFMGSSIDPNKYWAERRFAREDQERRAREEQAERSKREAALTVAGETLANVKTHEKGKHFF